MASTPAAAHAYYLRNREKSLAQSRAWQVRNPEKVKKYRADFERRRGGTLARYHGMLPEDRAAMWSQQQGRCYLCGDALPDRVAIDHDHSCCPRNKSCGACRRGLACHNCNTLIGLAGDDPRRLRLIADNLEAAKAAAVSRIAERATQLPLDAAVGE